MHKLKSTILTMSVHPECDNPEWGEFATHITINDQPGGLPSFIIKQSYDFIEPGIIRASLDELEKITAVAKAMLEQYQKPS